MKSIIFKIFKERIKQLKHSCWKYKKSKRAKKDLEETEQAFEYIKDIIDKQK